MKRILPFPEKRQTLKRKLFAYMFALAVLLFALFFIGMLLAGTFTGATQQLAQTLDFQCDVFERQISSHFSSLAVMGIQLSEDASGEIDAYLADHHLRFDSLRGSQLHLEALQDALLERLHHKLLESDCSGVFLILDTQVNPEVANAETSRSGLYLQRNSLDSTDTRILLYRGSAEVGKRHDAMPHRKWRLEFDTAQIPDYELLSSLDASAPLTQSYRLTEATSLPGTSERAMLLLLPLRGADGQHYGLCGFELSESYFKHIFAQPSELTHALFCLSPGPVGLTSADSSLSSGLVSSYYLAPDGQFRTSPFVNSLFSCESESSAYVGIIHSLRLCPLGDSFSVSALMPRGDYDRLAQQSGLRIALLMLVLVALASVCCLFFSKRYLRPLKNSLARIRQKEYADAKSEVAEIDDLFAFLSQQDRQSEAALAAVQQEKTSMEAELAQIRTERSRDQQELQRLAYSRKNEVDPADYENFRLGIQNLTATERRVFDYYLEGRTVKEITELMGVKESTIRFHNRNIYSALGVNSLKQLLRCAAIMKQEAAGDSACKE